MIIIILVVGTLFIILYRQAVIDIKDSRELYVAAVVIYLVHMYINHKLIKYFNNEKDNNNRS